MFEFKKESNQLKRGNHTYDLPQNVTEIDVNNFINLLNKVGDVSHCHVKELIEDFFG